MKFIIGATNVKIFAKSILSLSKIGDEIYIEPNQDSLTIRTVNSSRSAFSCFSFNSTFFLSFDPHLTKSALKIGNQNVTIVPENNERTFNDESLIEDTEHFKCKIPSKCLLSIFKNINSMEKLVEKCTITIKYVPYIRDPSQKACDYDSTMITKVYDKESKQEQLYDTKFLIIMYCKYGLRKTFILSISDCENLQVSFTSSKCNNKLKISSRYLHETINSFSTDTDEVTFIVESEKLLIKNYVEPDSNDKSSINTQVCFDKDEFTQFLIEKELDITFCLKEFKICLTFGNWFDLPVDICFVRKGRPIIFNYSNDSFEANFTFATLMDSQNSQSSTISNTSNLNVSNMYNTAARSSSKFAQKSDKEITKSKSNKRTLLDASNNRIFLGEPAKSNSSILNVDCNQNNDSEEDDALLTQALINHQERDENMTLNNTNAENTQLNVTNNKSPPAKKLKPLSALLFEDDDENDKTDGSGPIALASFLKNSPSNDAKNNTRSIYIEETDSE